MKGEGEWVLAVDDLDPLLVAQCRICHDEEDERCGAMESPCACSGSLKVYYPFVFLFLCSFLLLAMPLFCLLCFLMFGLIDVVCAQRVYTEVVRREREYHLRDLFAGTCP